MRILNNYKFDGLDFYNTSIKYIIENTKSLRHNKLVVMEHLFMRNNFVTLIFTLKVGEQSIPIWFKCDKTKSNRHNEIDEFTKKWLFSERVIFKAIDEVIELLSPHNTKKHSFRNVPI